MPAREQNQAWKTQRVPGIDLRFQDITSASGVPCCRSFVVERTGQIHTGTAAHPDLYNTYLALFREGFKGSRIQGVK